MTKVVGVITLCLLSDCFKFVLIGPSLTKYTITWSAGNFDAIKSVSSLGSETYTKYFQSLTAKGLFLYSQLLALAILNATCLMLVGKPAETITLYLSMFIPIKNGE